MARGDKFPFAIGWTVKLAKEITNERQKKTARKELTFLAVE